MNWYKQSNISGNYDPYSVNFEHERKKSEAMDNDSLFGALKDAIEASQISANAGKYYDQASVYRRELENRGFSINKQDEILKKMPSLHRNFDTPMGLEDDNPIEGI